MDYVHLNPGQLEILELARKTYGSTAQILVSNEELCELAAVCAKFPRYNSAEKAVEELYDKAVDEVADVIIVLDHIVNIFDLKGEDLQNRINRKLLRLEGWLNKSNSMEQTTIDREVPECEEQLSLFKEEKQSICRGCKYAWDFSQLKPGGVCSSCGGTGEKYTPKEN